MITTDQFLKRVVYVEVDSDVFDTVLNNENYADIDRMLNFNFKVGRKLQPNGYSKVHVLEQCPKYSSTFIINLYFTHGHI